MDCMYSPWNSPDQNTGVGSHSLLQGIFPTRGSNLGLPHSGGFFTNWTNIPNPHTSFLCHYHPGPWNPVTLAVTVTDILILGLTDYPGAPTNFCKLPFQVTWSHVTHHSRWRYKWTGDFWIRVLFSFPFLGNHKPLYVLAESQYLGYIIHYL